jgi:hypothetical protein
MGNWGVEETVHETSSMFRRDPKTNLLGLLVAESCVIKNLLKYSNNSRVKILIMIFVVVLVFSFDSLNE